SSRHTHNLFHLGSVHPFSRLDLIHYLFPNIRNPFFIARALLYLIYYDGDFCIIPKHHSFGLTFWLSVRIRHVKCDESKPECLKCTSTGRKCDGYAPKPAKMPSYTDEDTHQPARDKSSRLCIVRPSEWNGTLDELRSFDYFRKQTSEDLAYSLDTSLDRLVLQNSHFNDAIKHSAIALGSLGMLIRTNSTTASPNGAVDNSWYTFARLQYSKAIQMLQKDLFRIDDGAIDFTLICCFLFVVFAFLQGNDGAAKTHLASGIKIIGKHYFSSDDPHACSSITPTIDLNPMQSQIARIFHIFHAQASTWPGPRVSKVDEFASINHTGIRIDVSSSFASLEEGSRDLHDIVARVHDFVRQTAGMDIDNIKSRSTALHAKKASLLRDLEVHRRRFCQFAGDGLGTALRPGDPQQIIILRINRKIATISLAACLESDMAAFYESFTWQFWQIVSLATLIHPPEAHCWGQRLLRTVSSSRDEFEDNQSSVDSSSLSSQGLTQPLYYTAVKCRERATAKRAVELLETKPWREGRLESSVMAKIAQQSMDDLEKSGWYVPADKSKAGGETVGNVCLSCTFSK
ncbi:MAG: hypothetical protein Q9183_005440, partial [Haloplaca sp. 2 TL-2023]